MADTKISALPASTTPLAGTEVLPIVQSGATKQVSVANLTTGRALSATQLTLTTGNLIVASGQGIDFSATPGTGTSELLNDYEEGTWTPLVSDGVNDATMGGSNEGKYTKIGRCVTFNAQVAVLTIGSVGADAKIKGLPFTNGITTGNRAGVAIGFGSSLAITQGRVVTGYVEIGQSVIELQYWDSTTGTTGIDGAEITDGGNLFVSGQYYIS